MAFSPGGGTIATGGEDGVIRMGQPDWPASARAARARRTGMVAAFSPDGVTLVSAGEDGAVRVWDGRTGQPGAGLPGHKGAGRSVALDPEARCWRSPTTTAASDCGMAVTWTTRTCSGACPSMKRRRRRLIDLGQR